MSHFLYSSQFLVSFLVTVIVFFGGKVHGGGEFWAIFFAFHPCIVLVVICL